MILRIQDAILQTAKAVQSRYLLPQLEALSEEVSYRSTDWVSKLALLNSPPKTILVFKPDDIGDAVQALPAIAELRSTFPQAKLFLFCQKKTKPVYLASGLFDEIVDLDVTFKFVRFPVLNLKQALSGFSVKQFDVAIFLRTYSSYFKYFKKVPAQVLLHPKDPRMKSTSKYQVALSMHGKTVSHQSLLMLELVSLLTRKTYTSEQVSYPKMEFGPLTKRPNHIVLHPFAKYETKRFSENAWKELLLSLIKTYPQLEWSTIGGKEDPKLDLPFKVKQLQGSLSLDETGNLLQSSLAFIGNESGPGHLAAALGIPTLTLMGGHSDPNEWAPYGYSFVIRNSVPCSPCHRRVCPGLGLICFEKMTVLNILKSVENFIHDAQTKNKAPDSHLRVLDLNT